MVRKIAIIVCMLVGSCTLMTCGILVLLIMFQPAPPVEAMAGIRAGTEDTAIVVELPEEFPNAPTRSYVKVLKVQLLDGSYEHRVWAKFDDRTYQYFGALQPQFGDFPVKTLMLQIGDSRMIVGVVDKEKERSADHVGFHRSNLGANAHSPTSKYGALNGDAFFIPIQLDEVDEWSSIKRIDIPSSSGLGSFQKPEDRLTYWEKEFDPPLAINGLLIPVDQRLARAK